MPSSPPLSKNKGGRPKKPASAKLAKVTGRLLPAERDQLDRLAAETGISASALLRAALQLLLAARAVGQ